MMCVMRAISYPLILFETESLGRSQLLAHEVVQIKLNPKRSRTGVNVEACPAEDTALGRFGWESVESRNVGVALRAQGLC
jgi:hypothetical protein